MYKKRCNYGFQAIIFFSSYAVLHRVKRTRIFDQQGLEALSGRLKRVREGKGETQETLSAKSGITLSTIARIETARINPSVSTMFALARAMKVSPRELFDFPLK